MGMDMETSMLLKFSFAFFFVMGLMYLFAWFLKRIGLSGQSMLPGAKRRLKVVETLPLDPRRKLVIVRRDNKDHLILLGPSGETVVECNIPVDAGNVIELPVQKEVQNG